MGSGFAFSGAFTPTTIGLRAVQTGLPVCFGRFRGSVTGDVTGRLSARFMCGAVPQRLVYQFELDHRPLYVKDKGLFFSFAQPCFSFAQPCFSALFLCYALRRYSFASRCYSRLFLCRSRLCPAFPLPCFSTLLRAMPCKSFASPFASPPRLSFPLLCCARLGWSFPLRFTARPSAAPPLLTELLPR